MQPDLDSQRPRRMGVRPSGVTIEVAASEIEVAASEIRVGDVLLLDDGRAVTVTGMKRGALWMRSGRGDGVALGWKADTASGVLFRELGEAMCCLRRELPGGEAHGHLRGRPGRVLCAGGLSAPARRVPRDARPVSRAPGSRAGLAWHGPARALGRMPPGGRKSCPKRRHRVTTRRG